MKFENNWKNKTLENLEKDFWIEPKFTSRLIMTIHQLRKKQLKDFDIEDLRIMIGQNNGIKFLIPIAIEVLKNKILAEGDFYEGDLLISVLKCEECYWNKEKENWLSVCNLYKENIETLKTFETTKEIRNDWFNSFDKFESIH